MLGIFIVALAAATSVEGRVVHPTLSKLAHETAGRRLTGSDTTIAACKEVHYKRLCQTLTTLPGVTTPEKLLEASVRVATTKAKMAESKLASAMTASSKADGAMKSSLQACMDSYQSLVDSLHSVQKMLKARDNHENIMSELSAADTYATDCDDIFEERPELTSPITGTQRHVSRLVSNCLNLAATIKN